MTRGLDISASARDAYLATIRLGAEQRRKARAEAQEKAAQRLATQVLAWYTSLSPNARRSRFSMAELAVRFKTPPNRLGTVLFALNFRRQRSWTLAHSHSRLWRGPELDQGPYVNN